MDHYVYFGIYLKCKQSKTVEDEGRVVCSEHIDHCFPVYWNTKFCPICGASVTHEKETRLMGWLDLFDPKTNIPLSEEDFLCLSHNLYQIELNEDEEQGIEYLIPHDDRIFGVDVGDNDESVLEIDFSNKIIFHDIAREFFLKEEINLLLRTLYSDVEVKFGRISRWV